jgi:hypothetical protein
VELGCRDSVRSSSRHTREANNLATTPTPTPQSVQPSSRTWETRRLPCATPTPGQTNPRKDHAYNATCTPSNLKDQAYKATCTPSNRPYSSIPSSSTTAHSPTSETPRPATANETSTRTSAIGSEWQAWPGSQPVLVRRQQQLGIHTPIQKTEHQASPRPSPLSPVGNLQFESFAV